MDHSAFDAYGFLISAGDKSLFYTGDFRGHGRKGKLLDRFVEKLAGKKELKHFGMKSKIKFKMKSRGIEVNSRKGRFWFLLVF
jgi:hypothetical protein